MYRRFQDLYHKPGILNDSITGMEWMEVGYDSRTLREVTESCSLLEFLNELLTILIIGTPNYNILGHSVGVFNWKNDSFVSNEIFNKCIEKIVMYPFIKNSNAYKEELGRIEIELSQQIFTYNDALELLMFHNLEIHEDDKFEITTIPITVKRVPLSEEVNMIVKIKIENKMVTTMEIWYESLLFT